MQFKFAVLSAGAGLLLAALPVLAHHSFAAEFDVSKPITLKGKFVRMDWVNPHSHILLDAVSYTHLDVYKRQHQHLPLG